MSRYVNPSLCVLDNGLFSQSRWKHRKFMSLNRLNGLFSSSNIGCRALKTPSCFLLISYEHYLFISYKMMPVTCLTSTDSKIKRCRGTIYTHARSWASLRRKSSWGDESVMLISKESLCMVHHARKTRFPRRDHSATHI